MRFNPDADRHWFNFGAGADNDAPETPPEPPPQLFGYQGGGTFEATQIGTYHWDGPQHDPANVSDEQSQQHDTANVTSDGGTFQWADSLEMPQTGTYWQEPTFRSDAEFPPDDIQEAPPPPSEPFTASFFAA